MDASRDRCRERREAYDERTMDPDTRLDAEALERVARWLAEAERICVSTGAGMSAESGVPTFRDPQTGLWSKFNPQELATPEAFARDPGHVWQWYRQRRAALRHIEPHEGHRVLARWERRKNGLTIVTQNVDGLHHRAGSRNVVELHGRLDVARCTGCDYQRQDLEDLGPEPHCPQCGAWLRPGVVWFGELLPPGAIERAFAVARACELMLVIGTSGVVQPAASLAEIAAASGARVVEINPQRTPISEVADVHLPGGCRDALTAIDAAWRALSG